MITLLALLGQLTTDPVAADQCTPLADTQPAQINQTILLQTSGMPQPFVIANTIDRVSGSDYHQMEVIAPDIETALRASEADQFTLYTTWSARGLLKREVRDARGQVIAAFSYPANQVAALMGAEPGSRVIIDQRDMASRARMQIAVDFVGCEWLGTGQDRRFTRVFEKIERFDSAASGQSAVRVHIAEDLGRIIQEEIVGDDSGLVLIDTH